MVQEFELEGFLVEEKRTVIMQMRVGRGISRCQCAATYVCILYSS
jgi:hypothetical protein